MHLEDFLDRQSKDALHAILRSEDASFVVLLGLSGLDPKRDFRFGDFSGLDMRGVDLRDFNFSGSDLRGCLIDGDTIIDSTTILVDAEIDWVFESKPQIVEKMLEVENAQGSAARRRALTELETQFQSPSHTHQYLKNTLDNTRSIDTFFDVLDYFKAREEADKAIISKGLIKFGLESVRKKKEIQNLDPRPLVCHAFSKGFRNLQTRSPRKFSADILREQWIEAEYR
ncbi:pentapeptide repeat-containing protein [Yoonia algicola]|uniref:Pentapeptide repeat-containing protein n=1 Tax=Yoonia algicola TaxID=3137368 RepID=A0AAN0NIX8_9RHOB